MGVELNTEAVTIHSQSIFMKSPRRNHIAQMEKHNDLFVPLHGNPPSTSTGKEHRCSRRRTNYLHSYSFGSFAALPQHLVPIKTHTHGGLSQVDIHSSPQCVIRHAKRLDSVLNRMRMCGSWQMAISSRHTEKLLRKAVIDADWDHTIWSVSSDRDQVQPPVKHVPFTLHPSPYPQIASHHTSGWIKAVAWTTP